MQYKLQYKRSVKFHVHLERSREEQLATSMVCSWENRHQGIYKSETGKYLGRKSNEYVEPEQRLRRRRQDAIFQDKNRG
jgi:hypothetical protein